MKDQENTVPLIPLNTLDFTSRVITPELIDDFKMSGTSLKKVFNELQWINRNLGTLKNTVKPVLDFVARQNKNLTLVDIGCGSGDVLSAIHENTRRNDHKINLIGLDANKYVIDLARSETHTKNISFECVNISDNTDVIPDADIYIMSQFLHHFEMEYITWLIRNLIERKPGFILIYDLRRSELAFHLFGALCKWKGLSFATTYDGQLSISKGFVKKDMDMIIENINSNYTCRLKKCRSFYWQVACEKKQD